MKGTLSCFEENLRKKLGKNFYIKFDRQHLRVVCANVLLVHQGWSTSCVTPLFELQVWLTASFLAVWLVFFLWSFHLWYIVMSNTSLKLLACIFFGLKNPVKLFQSLALFRNFFPNKCYLNAWCQLKRKIFFCNNCETENRKWNFVRDKWRYFTGTVTYTSCTNFPTEVSTEKLFIKFLRNCETIAGTFDKCKLCDKVFHSFYL